MKDESKTKKQLIAELADARRRLTELEAREAERVQSEKALCDSEQRYRRLFEQSNDAVFVHDFDGQILDVNNRACEMLGYSYDQLLSMSVSALHPKEELVSSQEAFQATRQTGSVRFESQFKRADGSLLDVDISSRVVDFEKEVIQGIVRDITERRRMEEALRESEEKYRTLSSNVPGMVYRGRADWSVEIISNSEMVCGYSVDEFDTQKVNWLDLIHPDDRQRVFEQGARLPERPMSIIQEYRILVKDGSVRWVSDHKVSFFSEDGSFIGVDGIVYDITERVRSEQERARAEEALQDSRRMLQTVLDSIPAAVFWKDRDSIYLGGNRTWLEAAGLESSEEVVGKSDYDLPWGKEQADSFREDDRRVIESGIPKYDIIEPYLRSDGTHAWAKTNKVPLRDMEGNVMGVLGTYEDITERVRSGEERARAEEALKESEERLRGLFETMAEGVVLIAADGQIVQANPAAEHILGLTRSEIEARSYIAPEWEIVRPDGTPMPPEEMAGPRAMKEKCLVRDVVMGVKRLDGTISWISASAAPLVDKTSELIGVVGTFADITKRIRYEQERAQAEDALRKSQQELRLTLDATTDGIWTWDFQTDDLFFSPRYYTMLGYEPDEFPASFENWKSLIHTDDLEDALAVADRWLQTKSGRYENDFRLKTKAGTYLWIHARGMVVERDAEGQAVRMIGNHEDITERKQVEEKLKVLSSIVEQSTNAIAVIDKEGVVEYANPVFLNRNDFQPEQIIGQNWRTFLSADSSLREKYPEIRKAVVENKAVWQGEIADHTQDGKATWRNALLFPIRDASGQVTCTAYMSEDITERKQVEEELRFLSSIAEQVQDSVLVTNLDYEVTYVNRAAEELFGYSQEELVGRRPDILNAEPLSAQIQQDIYETVSAGRVYEGEYLNKRKDGSTFICEFKVSPLTDEHGKITAYVGIQRDVTERKQAEEALRESEEKFRQIAETIREVFWVGSLDWSEVYYISPAYEEVWGRSCQSLYNEPLSWLDTVHADDRERVQAAIEEKVSGAFADPGFPEYRVERLDGSVRWILARVYPVRDESDQVVRVVGIAEDITGRKQAEEVLARQTLDLERSNAELEQFAYVASHDLREPLRMVSSYLELLERRYSDRFDEKGHKFIAYAVDGAARMHELINGLLAYSRVGSQGKELEPVDCETVLEQVAADLKVAIEDSGAEITHDPLPTVMADEVQLRQVFQNLIGNAIKFHGEEPPRVHIATRRDDGQRVFSVRDNGIGIDPAQARRLFDVFQRLHTREEYSGVGIGLAICKKIVERHGGRIWVESEPGRGATFYFTLPDRGVPS